jgi:glycosyltransferase involved in cell wall biosynthesis
MPAILREAHIACLPSYREGLPKFLLEAASCGRPIVTTDTPGCREICVDGENGFLVPLFDPKRLADRLQTLVEDESLRRRMGATGRAMVEREFSAQAVAARTMQLYDRLLERGRA